MLAKINGSVLYGVEAFRIMVEVNVAEGLGYFITGQADESVKESLSRVGVAIKALGYKMPRTKLSVNLSPAAIRKSGAGFDLPIAIGILMATGQLKDQGLLQDYVLVGELGLDGRVLPIRGAIGIAHRAKMDGSQGILLPRENMWEAALVEGIRVRGISHLREVVRFIEGDEAVGMERLERPLVALEKESEPDFQDVRGQENVKRALEIAGAGGHNTLLFGPPGVGKTMLARRLPTILPPMTQAEMLETTRIHSLVNDSAGAAGLVVSRPFRHPHHTATEVALTGGGNYPLPGEISLAHNGVLFLDELNEFKRSTIEILRQPLEEGMVRIARAKMSMEYPASFMLVAASNPCFCGYYGHPTRPCTCSRRALEYFRRQTSGPLMDRIDLQVEVESVPLKELMSLQRKTESSNTIRERVIKARNIQSERFKYIEGVYCNARIPEQHLDTYCLVDPQARKLLFKRMEQLQLSARSYSRILKVSRTIADLAGAGMIEMEHLAEAIHFRRLDRPVEMMKKRNP